MLKQDKGQEPCVIKFVKTIEDGMPAPISADELFEVSRVTIEAAEQMRKQ